MSNNLLEKLFSKFLRISPILICFFCILLDSIPFYILDYSSFKTQIGLIIIYSWIITDNQKLRPIVILIFGCLIDLFNNIIFGFSSLIFLIVFLIQRKNNDNLLSNNFSNTWFKFSIFLIVYNISNFFFYKLNLNFLELNFIEIFFSLAISIVLFPMLFFFVNFINEKIKYLNE